jgi:hypothetical protein
MKNKLTLNDIVARTTGINIQTLQENEIFVFGTNLLGIHDGGAALTACLKFGAEHSVSTGPTGKCYAIPTIVKKKILIKDYVDDFIKYAKLNPDKIFLVVDIGCGSAGYKPSGIAPFFKDAILLENIHLPEIFWKVLIKK